MRLASLGYGALRLAGVTTVARRLRGDGLILCYHNVVPDSSVGPWSDLGLHMPLATFARQMRWLATHYDIISLDDFVDRVTTERSRRGTAVITFDDAYAGVFEHAWPLLQELNLPATVFVVAKAPEMDADFWWDHPAVLRAYSPTAERHWITALRGDRAAILTDVGDANAPRPPSACRPASWLTIKSAAASGIRLGAHSATHRSLPELDTYDMYLEVRTSGEEIARCTGVAPDFFAYPYGRWNDAVREAVRVAGYRAAFSLDVTRPADRWTLPRLNVPAGIGDAAFQAWAAGLRP